MAVDVALCIGINYTGTSAELAGCINDATDWADLYRTHGAKVTTMTEREATRQNMLDAMLRITSTVKRGQTAVITYSGHGTWVPDTSGDEADKRDEAIVPHDYRNAGVITDDQLYGIFGSRRWGARVVFISDSCHSGTVHRVLDMDPPDRSRPRFLPPGEFLYGRALLAAERLGDLHEGRPRTSALLLAGCADDQLSWDAWFETPSGWRANGAFTWAALQARKQLGPRSSYKAWLAEVREVLSFTDYDQEPQLDGTISQKRWKVL